jgi:hypothetical protein
MEFISITAWNREAKIVKALGYGLDYRGSIPRRTMMRIFLFATASRPLLGSSKPPIQWVLRALIPGVIRPECEAGHSPPPRVEVKNAQSYTSTPPLRLHVAVAHLYVYYN